MRAWASAYRDSGLVVVGAHTPEFAFEHEIDGVRRAMAAMDVEHPIALDNHYEIWRAFDNHYWPAIYLVDRDGRAGYRHFGEGAYEETDAAIRELLDVDRAPVVVEPRAIEVAGDWRTLRSPETYVGFLRGEGRVGDDVQELALNQWALGGGWTVEGEWAVLESAPGSIRFRFQARDLNLVLTPPASAVRFSVRLDGQEPAQAHGLDTDEAGLGTIAEPRLYQLVRQPSVVSERTFEITFLDPGVRAYVFTFG